MPDAQGQYQGDWAATMPDNTANIMHMADQYAALNQQRQSAAAKAAADREKQNNDLVKYTGDQINQGLAKGVNPASQFVSEKISEALKKRYAQLSEANKSGKEINFAEYASGISNDVKEISSLNGYSQKISDDIDKTVEGLSLTPEQKSKVIALAKHDAFYSTDPETGIKRIEPSKWNKNATASELVMGSLDRNFGMVASEEGVDQNLSANLKKLEKVPQGKTSVFNANGDVESVGYEGEITKAQEVYTDENGKPAVRTRSEPVLLPNGKPLTNPDGTPKMTIADDLQEEFLSNLSNQLIVKKQLAEKIGDINQARSEENTRRKSMGLPPIPMITGDSEEAKVLKSDIILERYNNNMPPPTLKFDNAAYEKQFNNRLKLRDQAIQEERNSRDRTKDNLDIAKKRIDLKAAEGVNINDLFEDVSARVEETDPKHTYRAFNRLGPSAQKVILDKLEVTGYKPNSSDIWLGKEPSGAYAVYWAKDIKNDKGEVVYPKYQFISTLSFGDMNLGKANPSIKERQSVLSKAKNVIKSAITPTKKTNDDPLGIF